MCCGAIDGKHLVMQCPPGAGSAFFNYKGKIQVNRGGTYFRGGVSQMGLPDVTMSCSSTTHKFSSCIIIVFICSSLSSEVYSRDKKYIFNRIKI